jgi:predicted Zn-dependent protease
VTRLAPLLANKAPFADVKFFSGWLFDESDADMETTARHELMHVLGLNHTDDRTCVMYPTIFRSEKPREMCPEELQMLREMYPTPSAQTTESE